MLPQNIKSGILAVLIGILLSSLALFPFAVDTSAMEFAAFQVAQAGSTGGTLGKSGKSASGTGDGPRSRSTPEPTRRRSKSADTPRRGSGAGIAGRWNWQARCHGNIYQGEFEIDPVTNGHFTGRFFTDVPGPITNGSLSGNRISFLRQVFFVQQPWRGTISGGSMSGSISGPTGTICSFTATR